ncbi:MAG: POTRA domain-containing protein [Spirosomataceae bacterium]
MRFHLRQLLIFLLFATFQLAAQEDFVVVRNIIIEGNKKTNDRIITREMSVKAGDTLYLKKSEAILTLDRQNITNTNLFVTVNVELTNRSENKADVLVTVKERLYFIFLPVFYLADRNFNEWWYERDRDLRRTIYGIYSRHFNLTGNNDQLRLRAETGFVSVLDLSYYKPYIDQAQKTGVGFGGFFSTQKQLAYRIWNDKLDFLQSENALRKRWGFYSLINRREGLYQFHTLELGYSAINIADTVAIRNPNYLLNRAKNVGYTNINYSYQFDKRDNKQYALRGKRLFLQASHYGFFGETKTNVLSFYGAFTHYFPIKGKFYGNYSIRTKFSTPKLQPFPIAQGLGYRGDLVRGYELYVVDAQSFGLFKTNFKYQLFDKIFDLSRFIKFKQFNTFPIASYLNLFLDTGFSNNGVPRLSNSKFGNKWLYGGGVGLDVVTWYNIVGRLNYAINDLGENRFYFNVSRDF